jgi:hypothetical protein
VDDKLELIVDSTSGVLGNFRTLEGALLYATNYPSQNRLTVRIINPVTPAQALVVPQGVSILGTSLFGGNGQCSITNAPNIGITGAGTNFITLLGNNRLENLEIVDQNGLNASLVDVKGSDVNIENCRIKFGGSISSSSDAYAVSIGTSALSTVRIVDNIIDNVYSGVVAPFGLTDLLIDRNKFSGVQGINGVGILVGTSANDGYNVVVSNNHIYVPNIVGGTDLSGIVVQIGSNIDVLRIANNSIVYSALGNYNMTNGISIGVLDGYTGQVEQLFVTDNVIDGISLQDNNVFGITIADTNNMSVCRNILQNIGQYTASPSSVVAIDIGSTFGVVDIMDNIISNCNLTNGILVGTQQVGSVVHISGNKLISLGAQATYIQGSTVGSTISDNILSGDGYTGIRWSGAESLIIGNNLNTIAMWQMIYVNGAGYTVSNNQLYNATLTGVYPSIGLELSSVSNTLIEGNHFSGTLAVAITSDGYKTPASFTNFDTTSAIGLTINNNTVDATIAYNSLKLHGGTSNCLIVGNRFPGVNIVDTGSPTLNTIGNNIGI